jgi:hypothetical protein
MKKNISIFTIMILLVGSVAAYKYRSYLTDQQLKSEILARQLVSTHQKNLTPTIIKQAYKKAFDEREQKIRKEIAVKTGIVLESWMKYKEECKIVFNNQEFYDFNNNNNRTGSTISEKTKRTIHAIMRQLGINPNSIYLISADMKHSAAAAGSRSIYIDENLFNKKTTFKKKFTIAHELTHLRFQDGAEQEALELVLKELHGTLSQTDKELINTLSRFHEERADIYALLSGKEYREGALASFMEWKIINGNRPASTHPTFVQREAVARAVEFAFNNSTVKSV